MILMTISFFLFLGKNKLLKGNYYFTKIVELRISFEYLCTIVVDDDEKKRVPKTCTCEWTRQTIFDVENTQNVSSTSDKIIYSGAQNEMLFEQ